jgi:hypothetical protein
MPFLFDLLSLQTAVFFALEGVDQLFLSQESKGWVKKERN